MTPPKHCSYYWYPRNSEGWVLTILPGWSLRPSVLVLSSRDWFCQPLHYLMALRTRMDKSEVRIVSTTCNQLENLWTLLFLFLCHILKMKLKSQCKSHLQPAVCSAMSHSKVQFTSTQQFSCLIPTTLPKLSEKSFPMRHPENRRRFGSENTNLTWNLVLWFQKWGEKRLR